MAAVEFRPDTVVTVPNWRASLAPQSVVHRAEEECKNGECQRKNPIQFPVYTYIRRHGYSSERLAMFLAGESDASQERQREAGARELRGPWAATRAAARRKVERFRCDSLVAKDCFYMYRLHKRLLDEESRER